MTPVWTTQPSLTSVASMATDTMMDALGIEVTGVGDDWIEGRMPVDRRTVQPMRLLHGGASVVLAETLGSIAANHCVDPGSHAVGLEVNANHVRGVSEGGWVVGRATAMHVGRTTQVWSIAIHDGGSGALVCASRLTLAVVRPRREAAPPEAR